MKRRLMFLIGATCAISVFGYGLRGSAQQAPASAAANPPRLPRTIRQCSANIASAATTRG